MKLAIIPARGGSKRIKNKNIVDFCGRPIIAFPLDAVKNSGLFDKIHVSTESEEIKTVVESLGFSIDFMRTPTLADDFTGLNSVTQWVLKEYEKRDEQYTEITVVLPTAALIKASDLQEADQLFQRHEKKHPVMACGKFPVPTQWAFKKSKEGLMNPLYPDQLKLRSQDLETHYYDAGTFYIMAPNHLEQNAGTDSIPYLLPPERCVDIDEPSDLIFAESLYNLPS